MATSMTPSASRYPNPEPKPDLRGKKKKKSRRRRRNRQSKGAKPNWLELPTDVTASILRRIGTVDLLLHVQMVCSSWWKICNEPCMWRTIDLRFDEFLFSDLEEPHESMCRKAVDRSQGQLVDISINGFGTDELLEYISDRSSQLKRLQLISSYEVSSIGLNKAVKKFPLLEELHLCQTRIDEDTIAEVGRCCPLLKSFRLNFNQNGFSSDLCTMAIANSMPELCHLQLLGNKLTIAGLEAILDGCPKLKSLDLRKCYNVYLEGDLRKRCVEKIEELRLPHESITDFKIETEISYESFEASSDEYSSGLSGLGFSDYDELDFDDFCDPFRFERDQLEYDSDFLDYDGFFW